MDPEATFMPVLRQKLFLSDLPGLPGDDFSQASTTAKKRDVFKHACFETKPSSASCPWGQLTISKGSECLPRVWFLSTLLSQDFRKLRRERLVSIFSCLTPSVM